MAPHSSTLAWKIPWTEEPDRLESMGSQRDRHDSVAEQQQQSFVIEQETPMDWRIKKQTQTSVGSYHKFSEKAMAPHSSTLAWKIPWTEEPDSLQSLRSLQVGHNWATSLSLFTCIHWRRKWHLTPVFLPGDSQGQGSLVGYHLWGITESDVTEAL